MSATAPTIRDALNNASPDQEPDLRRALVFGDLLGQMVADMTPTEAALNPAGSSDTATLAAVPGVVLHVVANAGTGATGQLALKIGLDETPGASEVVWNGPGTDVLRFNAGDAYTDVDVWYTRATDTLSLTDLRLDQAKRTIEQ